ncbi:MAG: hypothetical protein J6V66_05575 [Clostridia bacterium]|nr:hypothetical protein [Clostridia bacterium]
MDYCWRYWVATNVVSVGKFPICWTDGEGRTGFYTKRLVHTVQEDGSYLHTPRHGGWSGDDRLKTVESYIAYAGGSHTVGDVPILDSLKEGFAAIVNQAEYATQSTLAGFYCATCRETFSLEAGVCDTCQVELTQKDNLWDYYGSYNWIVRDLTTYTNPSSSATQSEFVYAGAYKYNDYAEMKASGNTFESFVGEAGNGLWTVEAGQLKWVGRTA